MRPHLRGQPLRVLARPSHQELEVGERAQCEGWALAGGPVRGRELELPGEPLVSPLLVHRDGVVRLEGVLDPPGELPGRAHHLLVAAPHDAEGVLVASEEEVETVLLVALGRSGVAAAGPLAAEPPALLIDRDRIAILPVRKRRQLEGRHQRRHPATEDDDGRCHAA